MSRAILLSFIRIYLQYTLLYFKLSENTETSKTEITINEYVTHGQIVRSTFW
jgi:hypothetical protein